MADQVEDTFNGSDSSFMLGGRSDEADIASAARTADPSTGRDDEAWALDSRVSDNETGASDCESCAGTACKGGELSNFGTGGRSTGFESPSPSCEMPFCAESFLFLDWLRDGCWCHLRFGLGFENRFAQMRLRLRYGYGRGRKQRQRSRDIHTCSRLWYGHRLCFGLHCKRSAFLKCICQGLCNYIEDLDYTSALLRPGVVARFLGSSLLISGVV